MSKPIRVLVVEDSRTVRERLLEVIRGDGELELVGEAEDGRRGVELCRDLRPDVVTMDMVLPEMSGLAATEHIMAHYPTPILIVSSSTNRGELLGTYDALQAGAVDVLDKPDGSEPDEAWAVRLRAAIKMVARIRVITHPRARLNLGAARSASAAGADPPPAAATARCELVALGASTGGPAALATVLATLTPAVKQPVVVVLHIGLPFSAGFAEWLGGQTGRPTVFAQDNLPLRGLGGSTIVAPPDVHLRVSGGRLHLGHDAERHSCRPSVDILFESLALELGSRVAAALLTGMGRDGAAGLLAIRRAGGFTVAQDEASSVVYGMPREAALLGAAERILPIAQIGPALAAVAAAAVKEGGS